MGRPVIETGSRGERAGLWGRFWMFCRGGKDPAAQASSRSHSLGAPDASATEAGHRPASQPQCGGAALVLCPQQTKPWGSKEPALRPRSPNSLAAQLGALGSAPPAPLRISRQSCAGEPVTAPEPRSRPSRAQGPSGALCSSGARRPPVLGRAPHTWASGAGQVGPRAAPGTHAAPGFGPALLQLPPPAPACPAAPSLRCRLALGRPSPGLGLLSPPAVPGHRALSPGRARHPVAHAHAEAGSEQPLSGGGGA